MTNASNNFFLPLYFINFKDCMEQRRLIKEQFHYKPEFELTRIENCYWVDWFWSTQFIVDFKSLLQKLKDYDFKDNDTADDVLSVIANDKMFIYPFICIQKGFSYSDITRSNKDILKFGDNHFKQSDYQTRMGNGLFYECKKGENC